MKKRIPTFCIIIFIILFAANGCSKKKNPASPENIAPPAYITQWGSYGAGNGQFYEPSGVALDNNGNVYVADYLNNRIQKFSSSGSYITQWGVYGNGAGQFNMPFGLAVSSSGYVYVADTGNNRIQQFDLLGTYTGQIGSSTPNSGSGTGQFNQPYGVAVDTNGNIYVADTYNNRIQTFTSSGVYIMLWGSSSPNSGSGEGQFSQPYGVAVDANLYVYVADTGNNRIQKFTSSGVYSTQWGFYAPSEGNGNGEFYNPEGVAVDNNGNIYVSDTYNSRIQKFTSAGAYLTQWGGLGNGNGQFDLPAGVTADNNGNVYVTDIYNNRIQKFKP